MKLLPLLLSFSSCVFAQQGFAVSRPCECVNYYLCNNGTITTDGIGLIDIRVGRDEEGPCVDYLMQCCNPPDIVDKPITPKPDINKPKGCGVRNTGGFSFKLEGHVDNEAGYGELPWMVAVLHEKLDEASGDKFIMYQCGGSLLHPKVVLTAAHCVYDNQNLQYLIRAGEWDTQTKNEIYAHQDRNVKDIIIHPQYVKDSLHNDIALLILDSPFELAEHIDTICLPNQGEVIDNARCIASGWGKDIFGKEGKYQVILKKVELPIVPSDICETNLRTTRLGNYFKLDKSFICAGGEVGIDTCKGDGGSPLVCPIPGDPDRYFQAGIVAWGIGCGAYQIPGVYTNVALFSDWINEQLSYHTVEKSYYTY